MPSSKLCVHKAAAQLEELATAMRTMTDLCAGEPQIMVLDGFKDEWSWAVNTYKARRARDLVFGSDMFADPGWDIMLNLYRAHLERRPMSLSAAAVGSAVPQTTGLRWIDTLIREGLVQREQSENDGRRVYAVLTDEGVAKMELLFRNLQSMTSRLPGAGRAPA